MTTTMTEKKCGASRCRKTATHLATDGAFSFYLCEEHAKTATCSPLNAKTVTKLEINVSKRRVKGHDQ